MNMCINCGKEALELHHVVPLALGGNDIETNKVWLCSYCHSLIHGMDTKKRGVEWKELQRAGIEKAKIEGKYKGKSCIKVSKERWLNLYILWKEKKITTKNFYTTLNLSSNTLYRQVKKYENGIYDFFE